MCFRRVDLACANRHDTLNRRTHYCNVLHQCNALQTNMTCTADAILTGKDYFYSDSHWNFGELFDISGYENFCSSLPPRVRLLPSLYKDWLPPSGCSVLQSLSACCDVLQCVAVCCSVLQCVAVYCSVLQRIVVSCSALKCDSV